jgi:arylsulfatase A-like enzyme
MKRACLSEALRNPAYMVNRLPVFVYACCVALSVFVHGCSAPEQGERTVKPNVVIILTDDQGYGDLSVHGNPILKTPNMDNLHQQSIRLTDFHVAPVCAPTRSQLLTGLDAMRNGCISPHGQRFLLHRGIDTMGDVFSANGYRTALYGKWHMGSNFVYFRPHERGFDDAVHVLRGGHWSHCNPWNSDCFDDLYYHNGKLEQYEGYANDVWFRLGTEFVKDCKEGDEPFLLYLAVTSPHGPFFVPAKYREPYLDTGLSKEVINFFGMIAAIDARLGEFMTMLDREGLRDNTILMFMTDNGTTLGENVFNAGMRGKKASYYEGGHRVPCFIRWPNGNLGNPRDIDALIHDQDILPTLVDLCGLKPPKEVQYDGISIRNLLYGKEIPGLRERMLVTQWHEEEDRYTVMWNKWRLVQGQELYDLSTDPGQQQNLFEQQPDVAARMVEHHDKWWQGVQPHMHLERFVIGADDNEMLLTAYDWWYGRRVFNWPHLRAGDRSNGRYEVRVERAGRYSFEIRRWPRAADALIRGSVPAYTPVDSFLGEWPEGKAYDIRQIKIRFGEQEQTRPVGPEDKSVLFTLDLSEGEADLQTWFTDSAGASFGAFYIYINRI